MAEFTVYASYELQSPLEPSAIWPTLEPSIEPLVRGRVTLPFAQTRPYEGEQTDEGFVFKGLFHKSQYVTPLTHVRCEESQGGTKLAVQVQRTGLSKPIVPLVSLAIAGAFVIASFVSEIQILALVGPFLALGGILNWALARGRLSGFTKKDREFLTRTLQCANPAES